MPTEQELDTKLGSAAELVGYWGLFVKNKQTNRYAVYDGVGFYPQFPNELPGEEAYRVTDFKSVNWLPDHLRILDSLIAPQSIKQMAIAAEWHFQPIAEVNGEKYIVGSGSNKTKGSAKKSLGPDIEFFFGGQKEETNPDGTLKHKGPYEFL